MAEKNLPNGEPFLKRRKLHNRWRKVVTALASIVVFCTTYALILPAITLEQETYCDIEPHCHTESCYEVQLICNIATDAETETAATEVIHAHDDSCYEEQTVQICDQAESLGHIHDESCISGESTLICTEEHDHTEECYEITQSISCGLIEGEDSHSHGPECYETQRNLVCDLPETIEIGPTEEQPHIHSEDCYESVLICREEEHTHSLQCYSNPDADWESVSGWERSVSRVTLTGVWAEDLIAIAESQLGYQESIQNYMVTDGGDTKGITRYGQWYGDPYGDWCAMFVSFCLHYAQIPDSAVPYDAGCQHWLQTLSQPQYALYHATLEYAPTAGDIIFFDNNGDGSADHVGIVSMVTGDSLTTIEGNSGNRVRQCTYSPDDSCILGYGALPSNPELPPPLDDSIAPSPTLTAVIYTDDTYETVSDDVTVIQVTGDFPEDSRVLAYPVSIDDQQEVLCAYHIALYLPDGTTLESGAESTMTLTIHSPVFSQLESNYLPQVYKQLDFGEWELLSSWRTDNAVCYEADGTSVYMVVAAEAEPQVPEEIALADDFLYENEQFFISLHIEGSAAVQEDTPTPITESSEDILQTAVIPSGKENTEEAAVLSVTTVDASQTEYQQLYDSLAEDHGDGLLALSVLSLDFYYQGKALDVSQCAVTAQITLRSQLVEEALTAYAQLETDVAPEAETGVVFAAVSTTDETVESLDSTIVDTATQELPVLTATVDSSGLLAVSATATANPKFTVQYYAWLELAAETGSQDTLPVIDTSGGILPQNGSTPATKNLYLEETSSGSGVYRIMTTSTLTQVYASHEYEYITAPNLTYFNRLYENGHYNIREIWILKDGCDEDSTEREDWDVYSTNIHFTNRSQSVNDTTVLIQDGAVIRLVFDTTDSTYTNAVNFYDYDITNDGKHTGAQGINSAANYSGNGTKLAFGNNNTDTGLSSLTWNGNLLNKYNDNGYSGCTFGLVTGLSGGHVQYASGVSVPNLFNEGSALGKTSYDSGQYTLSFQREGDTYTLSSVGGTSSATSLQTFTHRQNWNNTLKIWSNHFWPMDNVTNTDPPHRCNGQQRHLYWCLRKGEQLPGKRQWPCPQQYVWHDLPSAIHLDRGLCGSPGILFLWGR